MNDRSNAATQKVNIPEETVIPASRDDGLGESVLTPTKPVDEAAQKEAGRDRAEGGGYT